MRSRIAALLAAPVLAALVTLVTLLPAAGNVAQAAPVGRCTSGKGTIIAVDFHHWGGPIVRGCDPSKPSRGIDLLTDEGFTTAGDQHDGPQFLCRIGNTAFSGGTQYPTPAQDPCVVTPPASAYWSYWLAPAGQNTWSYSQRGAYSEAPKPGEVELWMFGGTHIQGGSGSPVDGFPVCTPNSLRAGGSPTSCTPSASGGGSSGGGSSGGGGSSHRDSHRHPGTGSARHGQHTPAPSPAAHGASAAGTRSTPNHRSHSASSRAARSATAPAAAGPSGTGSTGSGRSVAPSRSTVAPVAVDAQPASKSVASSGSAVPLVVGLSLAALVGLAGGWTVLRRRRAD